MKETTDVETLILRECFFMIRDFGDVPRVSEARAEEYWQNVSRRMCEVADKYGHHRLAEKAMVMMYEYLETKQWKDGN